METTARSIAKASSDFIGIGTEKIKKALAQLETGENLHDAYEQFNLVLNDTIHSKGDIAALLFYIACVNMKWGFHALAIILLKKCVEMNKDFVAAINNLGYIFKKEGLTQASNDCFKEIIKIVEEDKYNIPDEEKAEYYINMGSCLIANGTPDEAIFYFEKANKLNPEKDIMHWNRGLAYLEKGDYVNGFNGYEHGERGGLAKNRLYNYPDPEAKLPTWDGTPGKNIVVYGEQGIGDEIMFASMLPDLAKDCKFIFDCHPRLISLFRESFPELIVYGTRKTPINNCRWLHFHKFDAKIAIGSLANFYRKKTEDFPKLPYIKPNPKIVEKYEQRLKDMGERIKIGISWRGGIKTTNGNERYIPLDKWLDILQLDADFISLQYHPGSDKEVKQFEDKHGINLNHWQSTINDYDETAGLVANLDLIISVPQSIVHLAGAMGKNVWQLAPKKALWQVGPYGENMPWYLFSQNFWQEEAGQWEPVLNRVKEDLCNLLAKNIES